MAQARMYGWRTVAASASGYSRSSVVSSDQARCSSALVSGPTSGRAPLLVHRSEQAAEQAALGLGELRHGRAVAQARGQGLELRAA